MLVLTRRRGEGITVGPDVRIVVLGIKGGQVRLGIEAPLRLEVHREELYARIREENRLAASAKAISPEAVKRLVAEFGRRGR